ncbi:uncharacterized protein LOC128243328 [Mya arenaria]|uniref:uncharacterized protein LOC128243328 n=1 Tax=Mya arenaria TaxID=6604 RepID=UPI0022DFA301|nr:uncharacterized protein LOC128243328 [Mya arenaria]
MTLKHPGMALPKTILLALSLSATFAPTAQGSCSGSGNCETNNPLLIEVDVSGDEINIKWSFNATGSQVYGFRAQIYNNDEKLIFESPVLLNSETNMVLTLELDGKNSVCLKVLANATTSLLEKCEEVKINDLKMVIGILAGTIFLFPCTIALTYIVLKDRKIHKGEEYSKLEYESVEEKPVIKHTAKAIDSTVDTISETGIKPAKGKINPGFTAESVSKSTIVAASLRETNRDSATKIADGSHLNKPSENTDSETSNDVSSHQQITQGEHSQEDKGQIYVIRM